MVLLTLMVCSGDVIVVVLLVLIVVVVRLQVMMTVVKGCYRWCGK